MTDSDILQCENTHTHPPLSIQSPLYTYVRIMCYNNNVYNVWVRSVLGCCGEIFLSAPVRRSFPLMYGVIYVSNRILWFLFHSLYHLSRAAYGSIIVGHYSWVISTAVNALSARDVGTVVSEMFIISILIIGLKNID